MNVVINDQPREISEGSTIAMLLEQLEIRIRHVAVEVNGQLIPREDHAEHRLESGDQVEIVTLVGGG